MNCLCINIESILKIIFSLIFDLTKKLFNFFVWQKLRGNKFFLPIFSFLKIYFSLFSLRSNFFKRFHPFLSFMNISTNHPKLENFHFSFKEQAKNFTLRYSSTLTRFSHNFSFSKFLLFFTLLKLISQQNVY